MIADSKTSIRAIYEGNNILRLLETPPDLIAEQEVQVNILPPEPEFDWGEPYNPSADAVWRAMGMFEIQDKALAEWLAFSPEVAEQNQFLYEMAEMSQRVESEADKEVEPNQFPYATPDETAS